MAKHGSRLTIKRLREVLIYNPHTGAWIWLVRMNRRCANPGDLAGRITNEGYREIKIDGKYYRSARLAHFYMTGRWPREPEMDHINRVRDDDRWKNLRPVAPGQNQANQRLHGKNTTGLRGAQRVPENNRAKHRFRSNVTFKGKRISLGTFATASEARAAYVAWHRTHWGEHSADREVS